MTRSLNDTLTGDSSLMALRASMALSMVIVMRRVKVRGAEFAFCQPLCYDLAHLAERGIGIAIRTALGCSICRGLFCRYWGWQAACRFCFLCLWRRLCLGRSGRGKVINVAFYDPAIVAAAFYGLYVQPFFMGQFFGKGRGFYAFLCIVGRLFLFIILYRLARYPYFQRRVSFALRFLLAFAGFL